MKKIITLSLILSTQILFAGNCSQKEAELVANKFLTNEVTCGEPIPNEKYHTRTMSCEITGKKLISRKDMQKAGIRLFKSKKYLINTSRIEEYKIISINNKEASVELYNYSNDWYQKLNLKFVKEDSECYIQTDKITSGRGYPDTGEVFYISPYFNLTQYAI